MSLVHAASNLFVGQRWIDAVGLMLIHSVWEGAAIAALLALLLLAMGRSSPSARYLVACIAMLFMLIAPVATVLFAGMGAPAHHAGESASMNGAFGDIGNHTVISERPAAFSSGATGSPRGFAWAALLWMVGVACSVGRSINAWIRSRILIRASDRLPDVLARRVGELKGLMRVNQRVRVRVSDRIDVPAVVGWLGPVVFVPVAAISQLPTAHLEALLLHEFAHLRRHDHLINFLQIIAETLLFYHPAAWWISGLIRDERENCCDELAAECCGSRFEYARALATMETLRQRTAGHVLTARGGRLLWRIRRITGTPVPTASPRAATIAIIFAAGALAFQSWIVPRSAIAEDAPRVSSTRPAHVASAPPPTTNPTSRPVLAQGIVWEDLLKDPRPYRISRGDILRVSTKGLFQDPEKTAELMKKVTQAGKISIPYIGSIDAEGRTTDELSDAIARVFKKAQFPANVTARVAVAEVRGRWFKIYGDVESANVYAIPLTQIRLFDALDRAGTNLKTIRSVTITRDPESDPNLAAKPKSNEERVLWIPGEMVSAKDPAVNVYIRQHDVIEVKAK